MCSRLRSSTFNISDGTLFWLGQRLATRQVTLSKSAFREHNSMLTSVSVPSHMESFEVLPVPVTSTSEGSSQQEC